MKYRLLLIIYPLLLECMDELHPKKRLSVSHKNADYQDSVKIAQGELIESYREGGDELFQERRDQLSQILQKNGVTANTVARIALKIEHHQFEIFSPRNKKLETILASEDVHPDTVSEVVQGVKAENVHDTMEIDQD